MTKRIYLAPSSQDHNVGYYKLWNSNEAKNCNIITDYIVERLEQFANVRVFRGYPDTPLYQNEDMANKLECDSYYSIHTNASSDTSVTGVTLFEQTSTKLSVGQRSTSHAMAVAVKDSIVGLGRKDRGIKGRLNSTGGEYYADLRRPKMPAVIMEIDFHTNKDATYWLTHSQSKIGYAIANAIAKLDGLYLYKGTVNSKTGLNVRTGAGTEYPKAVVSPNPLPNGKLVYAYEERRAKDGGLWCRIDNNKQYWVCKRYLTIGG